MLLTFRRGESVAKLLRPRVRSLQEVADAEKVVEAADKAPPPAPGARSPHISGSRMRKGSDLAMLQYTSGSTGDPKGVMLTHANMLANIRAIGQAMQAGPGDVVVTWLPLYHDMGLIGAWLTPLHFGLPVVVMSPLAFLTRPEKWLQAFHKHRGTITASRNFAYELCVRKIADKDIQGVDLSSWRAALNGAEPVNPETLERFGERFAKYGFRREAQLPVYGLAEATLAVTVPPLNRGPRIDRVEDIIIKGGRNLYPHEVEELTTRAEGIRKGCVVAFGLNDEASGTEKLVVVAETRERDAARRATIAAKVTEQVSQGLGLPPDRVELIPPGSIPKTSSGKLRREETKQLYLAGTLAAGRAPAWVQIVRLGTTSGE